MQKLGCPESFTEPLGLYHLAKRRGMGAVTITDHNSIDGCLEIAHLDNVFVSCEYTVYFPDDRCKVHVLVHGITEAQHADLSKARENIFDFVAYAVRHGLHHTVAHPLYAVNDSLNAGHIERLVLLFKNFEVNGDIHPAMNAGLRAALGHLTPATIDRLSNEHGIRPAFREPWLKNIIGGSDDHSMLRFATTFTEVDNAHSIREFWDGVEQGQARVTCENVTPQVFARSIYGIMYQFCRNRFDLDRYRNKDTFLQFLERMLQTVPETAEPFWGRLSQALARMRGPRRSPAANASLLELVRYEADRLIRHDAQLAEMVAQGVRPHHDLNAKWFECVNQVSNNMLAHLGRHVFDRVLHARLLELMQSIGSAAALYLMLAPYFVGLSILSGQAESCVALTQGIAPQPSARRRVRVAHFTDTLHEVNGVARTLRQQLAAALALGKDYTIVTVLPERQAFQRGVHAFGAVGAYELPEYSEINLFYPPFLQMLDHCYREGFTHIHISTPGPVGLAGLGIARILGLPVSGTYHTAIPQYARVFTEDSHIEDLLWKLMIWFYDQMDSIYAPSEATAKELTGRGISPDKVRVYPRGVDIERFHPSKRDDGVRARHGVPEDATVMLYVGRVSKEKGLNLLGQALKRLSGSPDDLVLVVVGDGPYRLEMEKDLAGLPAVFTGYVEGDELPALYAACDFLVFPSATDTFGNVVVEAHASGIPVIVTDSGGPCENTLHGETGLIFEAGNAECLSRAIHVLASDPELRRRMGVKGREHVEARGFQRQFEKLWDMYVGGLPTTAKEPSQTPPGLSLLSDLVGPQDLASVLKVGRTA